MNDLTPVPVAGPTRTVVAGLLLGTTRDVELVLRMGWEATPGGLVLPVPLMAVRRAQ
ncbi:hypothetical protein [Actinacidiphila sp. ITFR-21]|uniref:hypothetical protein n=1 Tax=Actinacidiphila sp. ITFR-21 TaxID=3075199 RepID=UPI00288A2F57|nr:hypothetical protein [Streptomyces sp. ITFR-21]WNI17653.1 hypothetical protein RLT57_20400 [Streptomyces sp. ITFR-21]WNI17793.1 hypothetical protein RLT57_21115 [Streptomyces sp. ITFR-21]